MQLTVPHFAVFYIKFGITYSNIVVFILFSSFSAKTLFALSFFLYFSFSSIFFVRSKGYWNCQTACRERFYIGKMDLKTKTFLSLSTVFSTLIANVSFIFFWFFLQFLFALFQSQIICVFLLICWENWRHRQFTFEEYLSCLHMAWRCEKICNCKVHF